MVRAISHGLPVWNGYSGYAPAHYQALTLGLERREAGVLSVLREHGPLCVLVARDAPDADEIERFVLAEPGVVSLGEEGTRRGFLLPGLPPTPPPVLGARLPAVVARSGGLRAVYDLGEGHRIGAVMLVGDPSGLPRHVQIEIAEGPGRWKTAWQGPITALAIRGGLRDLRRAPVIIETPGAFGRLVRVRLVEGTLDELVVFAPRVPPAQSASEAGTLP
jgi:hypothetical protein